MRHCHALILALLAGFGLAGIVRADDSPASVSPHGGVVVAANTTRFEVVSAADGITVYPVTAANQPLDTTRWTGTATFYHRRRQRRGSSGRCSRPQSSSRPPTALALPMNLSQALPAQGVTVAVGIRSLPAPAASSAQFTVPYAPATALPITVATATAADAAAIAAKKTCPISGDDLHEMGMPVKVWRQPRYLRLLRRVRGQDRGQCRRVPGGRGARPDRRVRLCDALQRRAQHPRQLPDLRHEAFQTHCGSSSLSQEPSLGSLAIHSGSIRRSSLGEASIGGPLRSLNPARDVPSGPAGSGGRRIEPEWNKFTRTTRSQPNRIDGHEPSVTARKCGQGRSSHSIQVRVAHQLHSCPGSRNVARLGVAAAGTGRAGHFALEARRGGALVGTAARTFGVTPRFTAFLAGFCRATDAVASPEHQVALLDRNGQMLARAAEHAHHPMDLTRLAGRGEGFRTHRNAAKPIWYELLTTEIVVWWSPNPRAPFDSESTMPSGGMPSESWDWVCCCS